MSTLDPTKKALDTQLERISWGLFLIMLGGLGLMPGVPGGTWLVGAGLIMLGLNVVRQMNGIPMHLFSLGLGVLALLLGITSLTGVNLPLFPLLLILMGAHIVYKRWRETP